jgi:hypothetical protein|tara:strand:+ start:4954 stop:5097 length:144 start_codon:yes stop_codon:yes gene_type:complete
MAEMRHTASANAPVDLFSDFRSGKIVIQIFLNIGKEANFIILFCFRK